MENKILTFIAIVLVSCSETHKSDDLKLELLNKEIFCSSNVLNNKEKLAVNDEKDKNVVSFKIINNSKKKYLLIINEDKLETFSIETLNSKTFLKKSRICFVIESSDNSKVETFTINGDSFKQVNKDCIDLDPQINRMAEIKSKLKELDYPDVIDFEFSNSLKNNSFIVYPNETKYFKTILNLPIYDNQIEKSGFLSYYKFDLSKTYNFKLEYLSDSKTVYSKLPKYKKEELKENQVEIFDGVIVSNKIPIIFK